jgi:predicted esterase
MSVSNDGRAAPVATRDASNTIYITPASGHSASVVFMHGLGDTADGWLDAAFYWQNAMPHTRFILPTAKSMPVTLNMGMKMPAWYDLSGLGERANEMCEGIESSRERILNLVEAEVSAGIGYDRIVVGGFSQGGALSLWSGLQGGLQEDDMQLAGVLCMSGYLAKAEAFNPSPSAKEIPILMAHGEADPMVLFRYALDTQEKLSESGFKDLTLKSYPGMEHTATMEELSDVLVWLQARLPLDADSSRL